MSYTDKAILSEDRKHISFPGIDFGYKNNPLEVVQIRELRNNELVVAVRIKGHTSWKSRGTFGYNPSSFRIYLLSKDKEDKSIPVRYDAEYLIEFPVRREKER